MYEHLKSYWPILSADDKIEFRFNQTDLIKSRYAKTWYKVDFPNRDYNVASAETKQTYSEKAQADTERYNIGNFLKIFNCSNV